MYEYALNNTSLCCVHQSFAFTVYLASISCNRFLYSFTFRQLDAGDPHRVFSFVLTANEEDAYVVEDCDELKEETLEPLLQKLNKSDDLSAFMIGMRKYFTVGVQQRVKSSCCIIVSHTWYFFFCRPCVLRNRLEARLGGLIHNLIRVYD